RSFVSRRPSSSGGSKDSSTAFRRRCSRSRSRRNASSTTCGNAECSNRARAPTDRPAHTSNQRGGILNASEPLPDFEWEPASWQRCAAAQVPDWPDDDALKTATEELRSLPPLVFAGEARSLQQSLARVSQGEGFLLHAGDCAESFAEFSADNIRDKL